MDSERGKNRFVWSKVPAGIQDSHPPTLPQVGLFAPPVIDRKRYEAKMASASPLEEDETSTTTPEWLSWCWVRLGKDLAEMGPEKAEKVKVVDELNALFASEAREGTRSAGHSLDRGGTINAISPFRLRKRQYDGIRSGLTFTLP
jgi:hypothetical protein